MRQQPLHVARMYRHAPGRRLISRLDQMEKYRRTAVALTGSDIPVHHQTDIIKPVRPLHLFMARLERRPGALGDQPVIRSMPRLVAPNHLPTDPPHRKRRLRQPDPFAAGKARDEFHGRNRRRPVPFPLESRDPGTADCRLQSDSLERHDCPFPVSRRRPHRHNGLFF